MQRNLARLNARHLEIFLAMMTSQKQGDAALKLSISEPAVSKAVRLMEQEAGARFFVRVAGRLRPTAEAERIFPLVQRAISQLEQAKRSVYGLHDDESPCYAIAVGGVAIGYLVPEALRRLRHELPGVRMEVRSEHTRSIVRMVSTHEVDIGIATPPAGDSEARAVQLCETETISEKTLVAVLPPEHRLASKPVIRVADLSGEPLVMLPETSPTAQLVDATFHQEGAVLRAAVVAGNSMAVCCLVRRGLGVGLVNPLTFAGGMFDDLLVKPFRPRVTLHTCLYLPRHSAPAPAVARLVDHLRALALEC